VLNSIIKLTVYIPHPVVCSKHAWH